MFKTRHGGIQRQRIYLATAIVCGVLSFGISPGIAEDKADSANSTAQPGNEIASLILKLEAELGVGQVNSPPGQNAIDTSQQLLPLLRRATPSDLEAIESLASRFDQRASLAKQSGDHKAYERFSAFRDIFAPLNAKSSANAADSKPAATAPASAQNRQQSSQPVQQNPTITQLVNRGKQKLTEGDISAARVFFERAAAAGSGAGAVDLARTYDPVFLTQKRVKGIKGDPGIAEEWYRRGAALGDPEAEPALRDLESVFGRMPANSGPLIDSPTPGTKPITRITGQ